MPVPVTELGPEALAERLRDIVGLSIRSADGQSYLNNAAQLILLTVADRLVELAPARCSPGTTGLLPCPFCETAPEKPFENLRDSEDMEDLVKVWTMHHHCRGVDIWVEGSSAEECAENWNTRASLQPAAPTGGDRYAVNDPWCRPRSSAGSGGVHPVEKLWRECDLPEWFLGNGGSNTKLYTLYDRILGVAQASTNSGGEK